MPQKSKKKYRAEAAAARRWTTETCARPCDNTDEYNLLNSSNLSENDQQEVPLKKRIDLADIGDLFQLVKSQTSLRSLSVLIYLSLTYFGVSW